MKKNNKVSIFYIISSVSLLLVLAIGGCYGIYLSVGLTFVRNGVTNFTEGTAMNVSFGGTLNISYSMLGIVILSVALIVLAILDFISLTKQIVLFKQFKMIKESKIEQKIEEKVSTKSGVIFFAFFIDIVSFIVGFVSIIVNARTFPSGRICWTLYLIDGLVSLFSVISIILLIIKIKNIKKIKEKEKKLSNNSQSNDTELEKNNQYDDLISKIKNNNIKVNINDIEYNLLKLKQLKTSKILNNDEYENLRNIVLYNMSNYKKTKTEKEDKDL